VPALATIRRALWLWGLVGISGALSWIIFLNVSERSIGLVFGWAGLALVGLASFFIPYVIAGWFWLRIVAKPWATATAAFYSDLVVKLTCGALSLFICVAPMLRTLLGEA
jgi:hypothetical protein